MVQFLKVIIISSLLLGSTLAFSQPLERFSLTPEQAASFIPEYHDNSGEPAWSPVYHQIYFPHCQQACGVYHMFGYEMNTFRAKSGLLSANTYPANFTFNFWNQDTQTGVSFFDSFRILYDHGQPNMTDFGDDNKVFAMYWMNGADKWERSMSQRIEKVYSFDVTTYSGIEILKHWLYNHGNGSTKGGVAVFSTGGPWQLNWIPENSPMNWITLCPTLYYPASHGLTIVGYHDGVFYDRNNDGKYTIDIDINNDGKVDLADSEYGAWIVRNSYGTEYGYQGNLLIPYGVMGNNFFKGGASNGEAYGVVVKDYTPLLTASFKIKHNQRYQLKLTAGLSQNLTDSYPKHTIDLPVLQYQGGAHQMDGNDSIAVANELEMAVDLSRLYSYMPNGGECKLFLILDEKDPFAFGDGYWGDLKIKAEGQLIGSSMGKVSILNNSTTLLSCSVTLPPISVPTILNDSVISTNRTEVTTIQLQADGGDPNYTYNLVPEFQLVHKEGSLESSNLTPVVKDNTKLNFSAIALPFKFPFMGQLYDTLYVSDNALITFAKNDYIYPYLHDGRTYLRNRRCISAGYSASGEAFRGDYDTIFMAINDSSALFQWRYKNPTNYFTQISNIRVHKSGRIEIGRPIIDYNTSDLYWQGISAGDGLTDLMESYREAGHSVRGILELTPKYKAELASVSPDGLLRLNPDTTSLISSILVRVADRNNRINHKRFYITKNLIVNATWVGTENQAKDKLSLKINNSSLGGVYIKSITCSTLYPGVSVAEGSKVINSTIGSNETAIYDSISLVTFPASYPDKEPVMFTLKIITSNDTLIYNILHSRNGGDFRMLQAVIDDGDDQKLDRGETAELKISVLNNSGFDKENIKWELENVTSDVTIGPDTQPSTELLSPYSISSHDFTITLDKEALLEEVPMVRFRLLEGDEILVEEVIKLPTTVSRPLVLNVGKNTKSVDTLVKYLKMFNCVPDVQNKSYISIPLKDRPQVFFLTGSGANGHTINDYEVNMLSVYAANSGRLYVEGEAFFDKNQNMSVNQYLGFTFSDDPLLDYSMLKGNSFLGSDLSFIETDVVSPKEYSMTPSSRSRILLSTNDNANKPVSFSLLKKGSVGIGSLVELGDLREQKSDDMLNYLTEIFGTMGIDTTGFVVSFYSNDRSIAPGDTIWVTADISSEVQNIDWNYPGAVVINSFDNILQISYPEEGTYALSLTATGKNGRQKTVNKENYITVSSSNSSDTSDNQFVKLYPNPASSVTYLRFEHPVLEAGLLSIYTTDGKTVLTKEIVRGQQSVTLDVSKLSQGYYFISCDFGSSKYMKPIQISR